MAGWLAWLASERALKSCSCLLVSGASSPRWRLILFAPPRGPGPGPGPGLAR